ncbi:transcriptional regulator with XRE-family HTH domain [Fictibacillus halophilus]|uniref:Transcriptional regulator with XRE-family HTH domain n=1 Tax=Fictibacillus halophilus TaxID=1610490 RepID=A0ABV2LPQ9_9BACL|nr:helix-turn-helix transcriptional regulator [Fictibacillus halophilus]
MIEGEIIKFYRKRRGLSQEQLGKDICTTTHVSKIERGQTKYSTEIIALFSKRLDIDIQREIQFFQDMEKKLHQWHNSIIMQRMKEVEKTKSELDQFPIVQSSKHATLYQMVLARYYLLKNDSKKAAEILKRIKTDHLTPYEDNMYKHVKGIYYLQKYNNFHVENRKKAIELLSTIDKISYGNEEYCYHLAMAYQWVESKTMAYINAKKAMHYFKRNNNFSRAIQAESVMLLQIECATQVEFEQKVDRYLQLIQDSETLNEIGIIGMLLHNLGLEFFKRKDYENAHIYYQKALKMADKKTAIYLNRLYNFLDNSIDGKLQSQKQNLKSAEEGLTAAKMLKHHLYLHLFQLHLHILKGELDAYFSYLEKVALPFFQAHNQFSRIDKFGKQLYHYYADTKQYEKAVKISALFLARD